MVLPSPVLTLAIRKIWCFGLGKHAPEVLAYGFGGIYGNWVGDALTVEIDPSTTPTTAQMASQIRPQQPCC